jgi:CPA2 family monovalent cation:H+ antiporter-2
MDSGGIGAMQHGPWLKDLLVFLVAAALIVPLFHRARIGAVLGFLLIGTAVGPFGFGRLAADHHWVLYLTIEDRARVAPFAELGVMFLLFTIGLELSLARLWTMRRLMLGLGSAQFLATALLIGFGLAAGGMSAAAAIVLGLSLAMSSTAIVMQLLEEQGRTATPVGQLALAVLLFQDAMVAPVLFTANMLGREGYGVFMGLGGALLQAAVALAVIASAGYYLLRPLFRLAGQTGSRELLLAMSLLVVIVMATATERFGMSAALGAFLAGVLLSETEYRHQINIDLAPVKGLLLGLFFITVGMSVDVRAAWDQIGAIALATAALFVLKSALIFTACHAFRLESPVAFESALLLSQAGEFAFVVISLGAARGLLAAELAQFATVVVGLSMIVTPLLAAVGRRLGGRMQDADDGASASTIEAAELSDHVVIGGYGRVGRAVARLLEAENIPFIALDTNARMVGQERKRGHKVYFGDAGRPELLARIGSDRARAFVVTVNAPSAAERMVAAALRLRPDAMVFARAKDGEHAARLLALGAVNVIPEAVEASLQLGARVLEALQVPDEAVAQRLAEARVRESEGQNPPSN